MQTPKISIILPSYNDPQLVKQWVDSYQITQHQEIAEVIIVDDGSDKNKRELSEVYCDSDFVMYPLKENRGFTYAVNYGIERAKGEIIMISNTDVLFDRENWLMDAYTQFCSLRYDNYRIVGSLNRYLDGTIQHGGVCFHKDMRTEHIYWNKDAETFTPRADFYKVPSVTGCGLMTMRDDILEYGGFKDIAKYGYDDTDFCLAMRKKYDCKIAVIPSYSFIHLETVSYKKLGITKDVEFHIEARKYLKDNYEDILTNKDHVDYWQC